MGQIFYNNIGVIMRNDKIVFNLSVGEYYQGGTISYIYKPSDPGYIEGEIHGLICPVLNYNPNVHEAEWGCYTDSYIGTSWDFGTGPQNTQNIINGCSLSTSAAKLCDTFVWNGYSDWFLPSKGELYEIMANLELISPDLQLFGNSYWTSSETEPDYTGQQRAWHYFRSSPTGTIDLGYVYKNHTMCYLPCRLF